MPPDKNNFIKTTIIVRFENNLKFDVCESYRGKTYIQQSRILAQKR